MSLLEILDVPQEGGPPRRRPPKKEAPPEGGTPQRRPPEGDPPRRRPPKKEAPPRRRHPPKRETPLKEADSGIRSMSGRYTSYWNAFLFLCSFWQKIIPNNRLAPSWGWCPSWKSWMRHMHDINNTKLISTTISDISLAFNCYTFILNRFFQTLIRGICRY